MKRFLLTLISTIFVVTLTKAQDLPSYIPSDGLVAYYPFNGNANDASGNGNNGTVSGATLTSDKDGNTNKAYEFTVDENGGWGSKQDEITITSDPLMNSNEITLSAWVYPRSKPGAFANRPLTVFGRWEINVANEVFRFQVKEDNKIYFRAGSESFESGQINYDTWSHIAITFGSNGTVKSYLNGNYVDETNFSTPLNVNSQSNLTIGSLPSSNGTWYLFDGKLDELGYWNKVLTSQEIANLFSGSADILLNGTVSAENNQIKNVADPTDDQDVATKSYVDSNVSSFSGSYNDLTDTPTMYTQAQVDELINNLLDRIVEIENNSAILEDQDGNVFESVLIGNQVWATSDAKNSTYRDGTTIPQITDMNTWNQSTTGAWCYYENDNTKWKLYNWYAVAGIHDNDPNTPNKKFAPEGWRVATDSDWTVLENFLINNGYNYDGSTSERKFAKAISANNTWVECGNCEDGAPGQDVTANNSTGFSAVPTGYIVNDNFQNGSERAEWWTSTENESDLNKAWKRGINRSYKGFDITTPFKTIGKAVRIIKE